MNTKENILDAWIVVENLSEGSVEPGEQGMMTPDRETENWEEHFREFLQQNKEKEKLSDKAFQKSGIVLFLGIFDFDEVIDILKKKYNLEDTYEDRSKSKKFTAALFFDKDLQFLGNKFFYTMSGYIRNYGDFPKDIGEEERNLSDEIRGKFERERNKENGFHCVITWILKKYKADLSNFRYKFVRNLEKDAVNLHSFFIRDLEKAKKLDTENLKRYLKENPGERVNLDSRKESSNFYPEIFEEILQPQNYPDGRFPGNSDYALAFMQQAATNIAINAPENMRSVNGPPGTGKTTLLRDIFAHMLVRQAAEICNRSDKYVQGELNYWEKAKIGVLPEAIARENIVVASSNNGAVQNIVRELPQKAGISEEFLEQIKEADYFTYISNCDIEEEGIGKERILTFKEKEDKCWGAFSMEGGASANVNKLLLAIEAMEKELETSYIPDSSIYQKFLSRYQKVEERKRELQKCWEKSKELVSLRKQYGQEKAVFGQEKEEKHRQMTVEFENSEREKENCRQEKEKLGQKLAETAADKEVLEESLKQAQRNYDTVRLQKPAFLWIQKILNPSGTKVYFESLTHANDTLTKLEKQKTDIIKAKADMEKSLLKYEEKISSLLKRQQDSREAVSLWEKKREKELEMQLEKIRQLERENARLESQGIDFSQSYEELQKSNPWSDKLFRVMQTELFIDSLKVKKQFLYENGKNLTKARTIWKRQGEYAPKENGAKIITEAWQWLNFAVPVISTTFASLGNMFANMPVNSVYNLFVDEAGQALPQACVGAVFRSRKIMAVGDPAQIKPVLTLDSKVLRLIGTHYHVSEKYLSENTSVQTLMDDAGKYGFYKKKDKWIGIPLWVHRRSDYPMFTISNEISYNGLMVQGKPEDKAQGKAFWHSVKGTANDKFVKEQADFLVDLIYKRLEEEESLKEEIYVISPFRNVVQQMAGELDRIHFTKRDKKGPVNVGTVHTFQGKEAKIVYLILGADETSKGAASWAVSEPNIMNVAATRAKEEFYIIGDKELYNNLGSETANKTIRILDEYAAGNGWKER